MTPSNSGVGKEKVNCSTSANLFVRRRSRRGVYVLRLDKYPQAQAFPRAPRQFRKPVQRKIFVRNKIEIHARQWDLGKPQEAGCRMRYGEVGENFSI